MKYNDALLGRKPRRERLPYGIDVWYPKKVLNVEWDDDGLVHIISYKPGECGAFGAYADAYGLTREQTYWAWEKNRGIVPVAGVTPDEPCWQFKQEYPANADEAFQTSGVGSFIPTEVVLKARKTKTSAHGPIVLGVDPARGGGDKTGIIDRQGRVMGAHICKRIDEKDLIATAGMIQHIVREIKPVKVVIDTTGLGAGLYDRLKELLGDLVEGVNFGAKAYD